MVLIVVGLLGAALRVRRTAVGRHGRRTARGGSASPSPAPARATRDVRTIAVLIGACGLGVGLIIGAAHVARLHPPLLAHAAQQGAAVRAEATITGDPRVRTPRE